MKATITIAILYFLLTFFSIGVTTSIIQFIANRFQKYSYPESLKSNTIAVSIIIGLLYIAYHC